METEVETATLYRPVGPRELALIAQSGYHAFPPRLPEQPIFYPVLNEEYARQIANKWNVPQSGAGYVTRFRVRADFLSRYTVQKVGSAIHKEYWVPAEELDEFNQNILERVMNFEQGSRQWVGPSRSARVRIVQPQCALALDYGERVPRHYADPIG